MRKIIISTGKWSQISLKTFIWFNSLRSSDEYMHQQTNHYWFRQWLVAWPAPSHYLNQCWNIVNTLRPRQNDRHFAEDSFKCIFLNENGSISINISLRFVPKGPNKNIPALVQIMAWRRPGDKPLSEPMMVSFPTHICVTRPQWVNWTLRNNLRWNNNQMSHIFIWEIVFEKVFWKMAAILSWPQCRISQERSMATLIKLKNR